MVVPIFLSSELLQAKVHFLVFRPKELKHSRYNSNLCFTSKRSASLGVINEPYKSHNWFTSNVFGHKTPFKNLKLVV